jgi:hypothetical protein
MLGMPGLDAWSLYNHLVQLIYVNGGDVAADRQLKIQTKGQEEKQRETHRIIKEGRERAEEGGN